MSKHLLDPNLPIGVFDSGMGGLTVLNALRKQLPAEDFIYLGDTARLPYGTKSKETVEQYALNASQILIDKKVKMIVVACNTASSVALKSLEEVYAPIPVVGVIESGAKKALNSSSNAAIAVIATESTVKWGAYSQYILAQDPDREVIEWPCSLLVALAEEGWHDGPLVEEILRKVLTPLWQQIDHAQSKALVLGCTHFPVLKQAMLKVIDENTILIDSATAVAERVENLLDQYNLASLPKVGTQHFLATDDIERFQRVAKYFLPDHPFDVLAELVSVDFKATDQNIESMKK